MTVREQILDLMAESSPRTIRELAVAVYGNSDPRSRVKIRHRLQPEIAKGVIRSVPQGPRQNDTIHYHLTTRSEHVDPAVLLEEAQRTAKLLAEQLAQVRAALT
jgi:hypothetical protein